MSKRLVGCGAFLCLCCAAVCLAADRVSVTELPGGEKEITGAGPRGAHVLRLAADGTVAAWTDRAGNRQLASPGRDWRRAHPALELRGRGQRESLLPNVKAVLSIDVVSEGEVRARTTGVDGSVLTLIVQSERLGISVAGPAAPYTVEGRSEARLPGCRVVGADKTLFGGVGFGALTDTSQTLAEVGRTLALRLDLPSPRPVRWQAAQTDGWAWVREHVSWETQLSPGETLWLSTVDLPPLDGPVETGLYLRQSFQPAGAPVLTARLDRAILEDDRPIRVTLSKPADEAVKNGVLLAALFPTSPRDPVYESEQNAWFTRFDRYSGSMTGLDAAAGEGPGQWTIRLTKPCSRRAHRMRLWVVPKDLPRPEALGGPPGAFVAYFPGFEGRGSAIRQIYPIGDVFVTVGAPQTEWLTVQSPALRESFWRGESVDAVVQARAAKETVRADVALTLGDVTLGRWQGDIRMKDGFGAVELAIPTETLAPGSYVVTARAPEMRPGSFSFTIAPPLRSGMAVFNSPLRGPHDLDAHAAAGVSAWVDVMPSTGGFAPGWPEGATTTAALDLGLPRLGAGGPGGAGVYDDLTCRGMLLLQGIQSRQISFELHHTIAEHVQEKLRKNLIYGQIDSRFPSTLGLIFDYDVSGATGAYLYSETYKKAHQRRLAMMDERWKAVEDEARGKGASAEDLRRLKALWLAGRFEDLYGQSERELRRWLPGLRSSTAATADHAHFDQGQYLPVVYRALDFRYLETWNDQIYPNSAHDMQESFWTSLLMMEKPAGMPVWVTIPTAPQPGTHLRRALEAVARGATAVGYNAEGAAGMAGGWGFDPTVPGVRTLQERISPLIAERYGTWMNAFEPDQSVAILYSISEGGTNWGLMSPVFFAYYTLAQVNRPARLLTEDEVAGGKLDSVKALLIVGQTRPLPPKTLEAIGAFARAGGRVLATADTKIEVPGAVKLDDVSWPRSLWPHGGNSYHLLLQGFVDRMGPELVKALGDACRPPVEITQGAALVAWKKAPGATLVFVTNNSVYPMDQVFTSEQKQSAFYRQFLTRGGLYYKDVRSPERVRFKLREDLAARKPVVYDVFAQTPLALEGELDLVSLTGRVLLIADAAPPPPQLLWRRAAPDDPLVTVSVRSAVPLPVRIELRPADAPEAEAQEIYRCATPAGSCDTFAMPPAPGPGLLTVTDLATGARVQADTAPARPAAVQIAARPAVQVSRPELVRAVLGAKGLAIYVDARQPEYLAAARDLAARIPDSEVVFNPPVVDFPLSWDPTEEQTKAKDAVLSQHLIGWRRAAEANFQWTGAMKPAAVWNRPVVLIGNRLDNRLIADLDSTTVLERPALPDLLGPGRAFIQPVASPFWYANDGVVVMCSDDEGLRQAVSVLKALVDGQQPAGARPGPGTSPAHHDRLVTLGFEPAAPVQGLSEARVRTVKGRPEPLACLPIAGLETCGQGGVYTVLAPGPNLGRFGIPDTAVSAAMTGALCLPGAVLADASGECMVGDGTLAWRHAADGRLRWKMMGAPVGAPRSDGTAFVREGDGLYRVDTAGKVVGETTIEGRLVAIAPDGGTIYLCVPGTKDRTKADSALLARPFGGGDALWRVPQMEAMAGKLSADGRVLAVIENENMAGRDDLDRGDRSRLAAVSTADGKVLLRVSLGTSLSRLWISGDGASVLAQEGAYDGGLILAATGEGRTVVRMPLSGPLIDCRIDGDRALALVGDEMIAIPLGGKPARELSATALAGGGRDAAWPVRLGRRYAGTSDARILDGDARWKPVLDAREFLGGDLAERLAAVRAAPLVASGLMKPHEIPSEFFLGPEEPRSWDRRQGAASFRADNVMPLQVGVRFPEKGRYTVTIELANPKEQEAKMGPLTISGQGVPEVRTSFIDGNRSLQRATIEAEAGVVTLTIRTVPPWDKAGWKVDPALLKMKIEQAADENVAPR